MTHETEQGHRLDPIRMGALLKDVPGKWVALRGDEIVEARDTFDQVVIALHERGIKDATIIRAPAETESELVGLG
ncbi:MAG: hypothetical protein JWM85_3148 [Acidimicrobiaceae bacterium]|nr:hypothetical protein [Acidimicrobiaceae bacterium]